MNNIEQYLYENPELIERFMNDNKALLNKIKNKYADFFRDGDLIGRFLLSEALMGIVKATTEAGKALMQAEKQERGITMTDTEGKC